MELNVGIKHIIDRNAIIIMGAGASYGAKNAFVSNLPRFALLDKIIVRSWISEIRFENFSK